MLVVVCSYVNATESNPAEQSRVLQSSGYMSNIHQRKGIIQASGVLMRSDMRISVGWCIKNHHTAARRTVLSRVLTEAVRSDDMLSGGNGVNS